MVASLTAQGTLNLSGLSSSYGVTQASGAGGGLAMPVTFIQTEDDPGPQYNLYGTLSYLQKIAHYNIVMYLWLPGWDSAMPNGYNFSSSMAEVKTLAASSSYLNPYCITGIYFNANGPNTTSDYSGLSTALSDTLAAGTPWGLQKGGGSWPSGGQYVTGSGDDTQCMVETNSLVVSSATGSTGSGQSAWTNGLNQHTGRAAYIWKCTVGGTGSSVNQSNAGAINPNLDFFWFDNRFWSFRDPAGGGIAGQTLPPSSTVYGKDDGSGTTPILYTQYQAGEQAFINAIRSLGVPSGRSSPIQIYGNSDICISLYNNSTTYVTSSIQGLYDGVYTEAAGGNVGVQVLFVQYSPNTIFARMQSQELLRSTSNANAFCIWEVEGGGPMPGGGGFPSSQSNWSNSVTGLTAIRNNSGGTSTPSGTFWQFARYNLGFALMRQWAFDLGLGTGNNSTVYWMDEYNWGAGLGSGFAGSTNWMGSQSPPTPTTVTSPISGGSLNGVFRRDYPNCTVYLNPVGNGTVTYNLSSETHKHQLPYGGYGDNVTYISGGILTLQDGDMRVVVT